MSLRVWLPLMGNLENKGLHMTNITGTNLTVEADGKIGSCYSFNGASSYIKLDKAIFDNSADEFTYACWLKPASIEQSMCLFSNRIGIVSTGITIFVFNSGNIIFDTGGRMTAAMPSDITVNTWHHFVFTWRKSTGTKEIWIDGIRHHRTTQTSAPLAANATCAFIGASQDSSTTVNANYFKGCLNDVRIYDRMLFRAEIKELAKGLVCHYRLSEPNRNLIMDSPADYQPNTYSPYELKLTENLVEGQTYTLQFWDVDISHTGKTAAQLNPAVYWGSGYVSLVYWTGMFTTGHLDYCTKTFTITAEQASGQGATNALLVIFNTPSSAAGDKYIHIGRWKLEKGSIPTPWTPCGEDVVVDSSGYDNHALAVNSPSIQDSSRRYNLTRSFNGVDQYIRCYRGGMIKDELTLNLWAYMETWDNAKKALISCTQSGGYAIGSSNNNIGFWVGTGVSSNTYLTTISSATFDSLSPGWHMFTLTYDGHVAKSYVDTVLQASAGSYKEKTPIYYVNNGIFLATEAANNQTTPASGSYFAGSISDVRIYAKALSEGDIMALYQTNATVVKPDAVSAYEFVENSEISISNNGIIESKEISEFDLMAYMKYDTNTYVEPDGSLWAKVARHNNPLSSGAFASSDNFSHGVYYSEDKWYDVEEIVAHLSSYEIMVKWKPHNTDTEIKHRWTQTVSPLIATYDDIKPGTITDVTGYTASTGGLYITNNKARLSIATTNSSNWYGAFGCWAPDSGTIPCIKGKDYVDTGYMELYVRIDNQMSDPSCTKFKKSGSMIAAKFIEQ